MFGPQEQKNGELGETNKVILSLNKWAYVWLIL